MAGAHPCHTPLTQRVRKNVHFMSIAYGYGDVTINTSTKRNPAPLIGCWGSEVDEQ